MHVIKDGVHLVDWTTGDMEGDRKNLFIAYRAFLRELKNLRGAEKIFNKWNVYELDVDDFPRININYPGTEG